MKEVEQLSNQDIDMDQQQQQQSELSLKQGNQDGSLEEEEPAAEDGERGNNEMSNDSKGTSGNGNAASQSENNSQNEGEESH